ncbi:MAG: cold-shock protein [Gammaproteobacteria bacterium]|nr:MAG: cold-shock protein [Chloroflexota bacterium]TDJ22201.1 MAG: cold-shock protein [Gammaproteobacteria bacterium]TDJ40106.1 MAG: cold-shock protein [Gammaproteobacteria bacterium]
MTTGKVKWFNNAKGYGFILPDSGESDLFVHYSSIAMDGYKTLKAGQDVEFDMQEGPKGYHAVNIRAQHDPDADAEVQTEVDDAPREPEVTIEDVDLLDVADSEETEPDEQQPPREGAAGSA